MTPAILEALKFCPNLPSLPGVAIRILEMGRDPDVNIGALAGLIAKDPALAGRLLRVSNSPLYAQRRNTTNLHQAVMLLGLNATMTLALSFSLTDIYRSSRGDRPSIDRVWRRALISGLASRMLGETLKLAALDELYLAGLLQDLGILALDTALPERYSDLFSRYESHDRFLMIERESLGFDHGEAGAWLMRHWGLPERIAVTALAVHDPEQADIPDDAQAFVYCVAVAGHVADGLLDERPEPAVDAAADAAEALLGLDQQVMQMLFQEVADALPELGRLFEVQILSPAMILGLVEQAREILATRNLRLVHQATEHQQKVVEMEQAAEILQKAAIHDALTGLHNRRYFDQVLDDEFAQATDNSWPLTLGFIDLDHFKRVNDTQGHLMGDAVLVKIAAVLKRNLRERDYIMRYGGEEFVVLLPGHGMESALNVFERLRAAVEATRHLSEAGDSFFVTTSIGIAAYMDGEHRIHDPIHLVRAADRALYDAKRHGRNRIEWVLP
ncbi:GGDEF domain-containing protein [Imhoffiella purpurea]|uniref:diguanylate cyclase n=1 Tax=Imhoffiella purpurea TaxID=1249627 RepID=W9V784_9GAMM|nr:GGDEF domain-containing protein [Imhoffiella purpurea]EXJ15269.1 diguanylate cyclase [Imhoffiella purpurea]